MQYEKFTSHYDCTEQPIPQVDIEMVVMEYLRVYTDTMIEREELALSALQQSKDTQAAIEGKIKAERQAVKQLENSITKIFTSIVSGDMTTEAFVSKKEIINASIIKKKGIIENLETRLAELTTGKAASEEALEKFYAFRNIEKLDRDSVDSLIDRVFIHGDKYIEIVWYDRVG